MKGGRADRIGETPSFAIISFGWLSVLSSEYSGMWKCSIDDMLARSGGMFSFCMLDCDFRRSIIESDRGASGLVSLFCEALPWEESERTVSLRDVNFSVMASQVRFQCRP